MATLTPEDHCHVYHKIDLGGRWATIRHLKTDFGFEVIIPAKVPRPKRRLRIEGIIPPDELVYVFTPKSLDTSVFSSHTSMTLTYKYPTTSSEGFGNNGTDQ